MRRKWFCALLALVLVAAALPLAAASGTPAVYHLALNDKFVDEDGLVAANMPVAVNGTVYVPYTTFDRYSTGVELGVSYTDSQSEEGYVLTLYNLNGSLSFNVDQQTCLNQAGEPEDMRAIIRNGKVYVPASSVCQFFRLQYSYIPTRTAGVLIRIKSSSAVLNDVVFQQTSASFMQNRYNQFIQSLNAAATPSPTPTARPAATPAPSATQAPEETDGPTVRLAFRCTTGEGTDRILDTLESWGAKALFLFRPEDLEAREEQLLRALGEGHTVGLLVEGGSLEEARQALAQGNETLRRLSWTRTWMACVDDPAAGVTSALREEGWKLWSGNVDGRGESVEWIMTRAQRRGSARVTLDDSGTSAGSLGPLLARVRAENGALRPVYESDLDE